MGLGKGTVGDPGAELGVGTLDQSVQRLDVACDEND